MQFLADHKVGKPFLIAKALNLEKTVVVTTLKSLANEGKFAYRSLGIDQGIALRIDRIIALTTVQGIAHNSKQGSDNSSRPDGMYSLREGDNNVGPTLKMN